MYTPVLNSNTSGELAKYFSPPSLAGVGEISACFLPFYCIFEYPGDIRAVSMACRAAPAGYLGIGLPSRMTTGVEVVLLIFDSCIHNISLVIFHIKYCAPNCPHACVQPKRRLASMLCTIFVEDIVCPY